MGETVRVISKCALSATVPKNSKGYTHALLGLEDDDKYVGAGIIEPGTTAQVVDYVWHGTGTCSYPLLDIKGTRAVSHPRFIELA